MIPLGNIPGIELGEKIPEGLQKLLKEVESWPYFTLNEYDMKAKNLSGLYFIIIHESPIYKDDKPIPNEKIIRYTIGQNMRTDYPREGHVECTFEILWTLQKASIQGHILWSLLDGLVNPLTSKDLKLHIFKDHRIYPIPEDLTERIIRESYNSK